MDRIIEGLLAIVIAIVLVVYEMVDTIRCKFNFHKSKERKDGMGITCEICGIGCADYHNRQSQQHWFKFLAFLRSKMERFKEFLTEPTEKYTEKGRKDPFYHPTNWTKLKRIIWRLFWMLISLTSLIGLCIFLINHLP